MQIIAMLVLDKTCGRPGQTSRHVAYQIASIDQG